MLHGSPSPFDFDQPHQDELLSNFTPVTPTEVTQLLHSMSNKSSPLDYVPTSLLKSCADTFSIIISHLANLSFEQGTFPSKFKLALISPLLKKPGLPKSDLANFRPISNLNTIGKILERLALARLLPHISISPSFGPLQSAYRKYHSTETALLKLTNDIMENIDSGKITILTALDMSAAFDTLDHTTLLHRLQYTFGLSGFVITWIRSYLTNRSSFVKIDSSSSPCTTIDTGVPQGSVLGPLLFVLFISPIANVINSDQPNGNNSISFHQYADDTQLYIGTNSSTLAHQVALIESCTQRVHDWLLNNGLHLNPTKSEAIAVFQSKVQTTWDLGKIDYIHLSSWFTYQTSVIDKKLGCLSWLKNVLWQTGIWNLQSILLSHSCSASHSIFSHHWGLQDNSYCNSRISTRLLQLSSSWHIYLKPCSTTACTKYTCSSCYPKISVQSHLAGSFWFALASHPSQN